MEIQVQTEYNGYTAKHIWTYSTYSELQTNTRMVVIGD